MNVSAQISPLQDEVPSNYADRLGVAYTSTVNSSHKKSKGQFFTPIAIAKLMASFSKNEKEEIKILDPGCGTAILTCALVENLFTQNSNLKKIEITAYETDADLISFSEKSLNYLKLWMKKKGVILSFIILIDDFVLDNSNHINRLLSFSRHSRGFFDIIISNPPYFKLSKDDERTKVVKEAAGGQSNIYAVFMAVAAKLLSESGELIFITPRSFASGSYFKNFREFFFQAIEVENIHLFVSRKDTFNRDSVLQETVILKGRKKGNTSIGHNITLSSSHGIKDIHTPSIKLYKPEELIDFKTKEKMLHLPTNGIEERVIALFKSWPGNLHKYNIQISTGPVVSFRATNFIYDQYENTTVFMCPLFWLHNINKMQLDWPLSKPNKGQYIRILDGSIPILIPNKEYIFLRRFSTKDDKSRLIAAPYFGDLTTSKYIGVENKVNYIYRPMGHLEKNEIVGLCALLNSKLFDMYFRTFNGNVNVSATELREISLPSLDIIMMIGDKVIECGNVNVTYIDELVNEIFELNDVPQIYE